jgi:hypothetical protein
MLSVRPTPLMHLLQETIQTPPPIRAIILIVVVFHDHISVIDQWYQTALVSRTRLPSIRKLQG